MSLIITGGFFCGRKIHAPAKLLKIRPTSGRLRESLFNIIGERLPGVTFLDLYAGVGTVGLEAISRGASCVCMVEKDPQIYKCIQKNCQALNTSDVIIKKMNVTTFCRNESDTGGHYDIVFADPPFTMDFKNVLPEVLSVRTKKGMGIIQYPIKAPPEWLGEAGRIKKYGESGLAFFYT